MEYRLSARVYIALLFSLSLLGACSQKTPSGDHVSRTEGSVSFHLSGNFPTCSADSMHIYSVDGLDLKKLISTPIIQNGDKASFSVKAELPTVGFYYIGQAPQNLRPIILGEKSEVIIEGNCLNLPTYFKIKNSSLNQDWEWVQAKMQSLQEAQQRAAYEPGSNIQAEDVLEAQLSLRDSLLDSSPILGKTMALSIFRPYSPEDEETSLDLEAYLNYLDTEYCKYADLNDPDYAYITLLSDFTQNYFQTIFNSQIDASLSDKFTRSFLDRFPENSQARKNVMAIALSVLDRMKNGAFIQLAKNYSDTYELSEEMQRLLTQQSEYIARVEKEREEYEKQFGIGAIPPDIKLNTPEGKPLSLYSLRGKVVLLDFWASWCGPCRQENPNVVRAFNQYKDKGFTVYSVSLDRDRQNWLSAMKQDRMDWYHVSDLKYFNSKAARLYKVDAIPATFLLDKEGKIIAKNLRGAALHKKLAEILQ